MNEDIKVSVIVPVYNAERYLSRCLDSICGQTLRQIEILCVDDGSDDGSPRILRQYADRDPRVRLLQQTHQYAGAARNLGKARARGKYLVFWDADDFFAPEALEKMYLRCEADEADICLCGGRQFFDAEQTDAPGPRYLRKKEIPGTLPFDRRSAEEHVVSITVEAPWNKMFLRSFVEKTGLDFQASRNANDVFFVISALCLADRITLVDQPLVTYRKQKPAGLVSTLSQGLLPALQAWISTAEYLRQKDAFPEKSFANRALESILYLLNNTPDWEVYREGFLLLQNGPLETLGIRPNAEEGYYYIDFHPEAARRLYEDTPEQFAKWIGSLYFTREAAVTAQCRSLREQNRALNKRYAAITGSASYRLGRKLTWLPRKMRDLFSKRK